nr:hypothetical protein GCM10010200_106250 [Actinomadura rugatobispora]
MLLTVVHVCVWDPYFGGSVAVSAVDLRAAVPGFVDARVHETAFDVRMSPLLERGPVAARLIGAAVAVGLLVVASRGWGGFTGRGRPRPVSVLIVRGGSEPAPEREPGRVVGGVDGSLASRAALETAFTEADAHGAP